jgi:hypothetical protein
MPYLHLNKLSKKKKRREFNLPTFILVIDYEKAYDNLNREKLWQILKEEDMQSQLIRAMQSLYRNSNICIKYLNGQISEPIITNKGVRKGLGLSPSLFKKYIDRIVKDWKQAINNGIQLTKMQQFKQYCMQMIKY